jgi:hypothetical protein
VLRETRLCVRHGRVSLEEIYLTVGNNSSRHSGIGDSIGGCGARIRKAINLAGRYQGYHRFLDETGTFEIFWRADGWWWSRAPLAPQGEAVGPFLTSTEAYSNATSQRQSDFPR